MYAMWPICVNWNCQIYAGMCQGLQNSVRSANANSINANANDQILVQKGMRAWNERKQLKFVKKDLWLMWRLHNIWLYSELLSESVYLNVTL